MISAPSRWMLAQLAGGFGGNRPSVWNPRRWAYQRAVASTAATRKTGTAEWHFTSTGGSARGGGRGGRLLVDAVVQGGVLHLLPRLRAPAHLGLGIRVAGVARRVVVARDGLQH